MDLRFSAEELAFRDEVRGFIRDNCRNIRGGCSSGQGRKARHPLAADPEREELGGHGWPNGAAGWTPIQRMMFLEEIQTFPAPEVNPFNITMLGPVLIQFGSEEQKSRFLPRAANLDDWWCQGFSEPGAGSDLAALKTAARLDGDHYVVNGQKIWTSTAHMADWCFCLVRTNPQAAKRQEGISFLLIDMKTPGITVRPIISIDGEHHLNEVFFDDVRVPVAMRIYEENRGWDVAKFLLGNERTGIARLGKSKERVNFAKQKARRPAGARQTAQRGSGIPPPHRGARNRAEIARNHPVARAVGAKGGRTAAGSADRGAEAEGHRALAGDDRAGGGCRGPAGDAGLGGRAGGAEQRAGAGAGLGHRATRSYLFLRAASIYGGTNEIMKNIVSKAWGLMRQTCLGRHSGTPQCGEPGIHIPEARVHGFRASPFGRSRNDRIVRGGTF
jgi:hypothetical protein